MNEKRVCVEIAPDGTPIGQWPIPGGYDVTSAAMTADGDAYVLVGRKATAEYQNYENLILRLDRSNGEWTTNEYDHLKETGDPGGVELHGAYGDGVIIRVNDHGFLTVRPTIPRQFSRRSGPSGAIQARITAAIRPVFPFLRAQFSQTSFASGSNISPRKFRCQGGILNGLPWRRPAGTTRRDSAQSATALAGSDGHMGTGIIRPMMARSGNSPL